MSMYLDSESVKASFFINKDDFDKAFTVLMHALDEKPNLCRMDREYRNSKTIIELITHCSWCVDLDDDGNICGIKHCGTNVSEEDLLFITLSPFVVSGSFIEYTREGSSFNQKHHYGFHDSKITVREWAEQTDMQDKTFWEEIDVETFDLRPNIPH